jgi:hypothetical protein
MLLMTYVPYRTSDDTWLIHNPDARAEFPAFEITDGAITLYPTQEAAEQAAIVVNRKLNTITRAEKEEAHYRKLVDIYWKAYLNVREKTDARTSHEIALFPVLAVRDEVLKLGDRILKTEAPEDVLLQIFTNAYNQAEGPNDRIFTQHPAGMLAGVRALSTALTVTYRVDARP